MTQQEINLNNIIQNLKDIRLSIINIKKDVTLQTSIRSLLNQSENKVDDLTATFQSIKKILMPPQTKKRKEIMDAVEKKLQNIKMKIIAYQAGTLSKTQLNSQIDILEYDIKNNIQNELDKIDIIAKFENIKQMI